jgi:hypothetical protein
MIYRKRTLVAKTLSMGKTYTSGLIAKGAFIFVPTILDPSISSSWLIWPFVAVIPWKAIFRTARYVQTYASLSFIAKTPYLMVVPTKQFVWPYLLKVT